MRTWVMPIYVVFGLVGGAAAMVLTGAWAPTLIGDAGPLARFGLPVARFAFNTAMTLTVAGLIMASLVFPRTDAITRERKGTVTREEDLDSAWLGSVRIAQVASVVWTLSSVAVLVFTYVSTAGGQAYAGNFSAQLGQYVTQVDSGRLWLTIILSTAFASTVIFAVRSFAGVAWAAALSLFPLIPLGLMGHTVGASGHTQAVNSLGLHLLAVIMWVGGIVVLALLAPRLIGRADLRNIVERYSQLALAAVLVVGFSGFMNAVLRVSSLSDWQTPYGMLIIAKTVATVAVAVIGLWHRKFVIGRLGEVLNTRAQLRAKRGAEPTADQVSARVEFWRLLLVETALLAATLGAGIALARSQPPIPQEPPPTPSPAEILSYEPLPPEPTFANYFTQWLWDPLWIVVAVGTSYLYIRGYLAIRKKGGEWPVMRVIWWVTGMALLVYVTCGGPVVYGRVLFSGHMIQHMLLVMVVPLPMVLGAPITLLMRAAPARQDGSRGFREWILILIHSRYLRFWAHPIVASINFAGSLVVFYWGGLMWPALKTHVGHEIMIIHFLAAGYLFSAALVGIDPGTKRYPPAISFLILLITMAFHAFFGISIMGATILIEGDWFGNMGQEWISAIDDQQLGGGIAWGIGEIPTLLMAIIAAVHWNQQSEREAKRADRSEARTGDAELRAYNEMLERLNKAQKK
ncbi:cytochrome c oxidase assembly protein [Brevibacterium sp. UMB10442]|nr:cytochrome c oxidase assembly protein [Brevibacterium sp. UMB10442]